MRPEHRLNMIALFLLTTAAYSFLVITDRDIARPLASGYVAVVVSVFLIDLWSRHHHHGRR